MADTQTSEWIEHDGKGMPVGIDDVVQRKYRDGLVGKWLSTRKAQNVEMWTHRDHDDDITHFRVVKT